MLAVSVLAVSVVAVVVGGAAREAVLFLWLALIGVSFADAVVSVRRNMHVSVDFPHEVFVGETASITIAIQSDLQKLSAKLDWPRGLTGPDEFAFDVARDRLVAVVPCRAVRRGNWSFQDIWLLWPSRLGLFEFVPRIPMELSIRVVPNIRMVQSGEITSTVVSTLYGVKENRAIGEGSEFHQLREFARGMDVKSIDWKRSAKRRSLLAKELRAERNHHVIIALDNGYLMREEIAGLPKIDHAITAALATAWAAAIGGDLVGYFSYDVRPRTFSKPEPGRIAFARLRSWTSDLDYVSRETNHTLAMSELNARTPKRSLIIVFTDFIDTTSAELLVENVSILSKRHLVVFVTIRDPETERVVGSPSGSLDEAAKVVSSHQALHERRLVFERLTRLGITIVDARPGDVTSQLVSTYLEIKARELV